jgi:hypothetical protein
MKKFFLIVFSMSVYFLSLSSLSASTKTTDTLNYKINDSVSSLFIVDSNGGYKILLTNDIGKYPSEKKDVPIPSEVKWSIFGLFILFIIFMIPTINKLKKKFKKE